MAPKPRRVTEEGTLEPVEVNASQKPSVLLDELSAELAAGAFTGKGDKAVVMAMLETFGTLLKRGIDQAAAQRELRRSTMTGLHRTMKMLLRRSGVSDANNQACDAV